LLVCTSLYFLFVFIALSRSDPFVKLLLDERLVGQTQVVKNNVNPSWNETFTLALPLQASILDSKLVIEVYDHDNLSKHDLLGVTSVTGEALRQLLAPDTTSGSWEQTLALEVEQKARGKVKTVQCGDITLQGCGLVGMPLGATVTPQVLHESVSSDLNALGAQSDAGAEDSRPPAVKAVEEAYEELHNLAPERFTLTAKMARGLINADTLKHW
jgi:Ca2+-dependent lipid-binding protein